ncbi:MAG: FAD binding domain-containing protein [Pseudomonadota bacterium]
MKPAKFEYTKPASIEEALSLLTESGDDAKVLAGGQSLVPMMNLRLMRPERIVDINGLSSERFVHIEDNAINIGMLARHADFENNSALDAKLPVLGHVVKDIAHRAIRNRGTFAGSLSHNDPSAEWPLMAVLLDAEITLQNAESTRQLTAKDFLVSYLTTALEPDELLCNVSIPVPDANWGWAFTEFNRRLGDFAIASAAAFIGLKDGQIEHARLALGGVDYTAHRQTDVEAMLIGEVPNDELWAEAGALVSKTVDPSSDLQATAMFRRHLSNELTQRVLTEAAQNV